MASSKRVRGLTIEINGDTTGLDQALKKTNSTLNATQRDLNDVNKLLKLDPSNTELLTQKQKLLSEAINTTKDKLQTLKTAQEQAKQQLANGEIGQKQYDALQREIAETEQQLKKFEDAANDAEGEMQDLAKEADNAADKTGELDISLGSMVKNAAVNLAVDAMRKIGDKAIEAAKYVIEVGSNFEAAMSRVESISGATGSDLDALTEKAKQMGSTTKFSASEAASAMEYMAMAGWKTEDMLRGIDGVMNLAAASGEDLATTSDIVTDALTAFGKSADESGRLADIMAAASSNANTNVSMMGETFKYAAPVMGALGISMEDAAVATGLMANSGIKASQAGTALRTGLSNLAKPTKPMKEWIDKYNISLVENEDGSVNLRETMIQLREKMSGLSETEQAAATSAIFGKNAMSGWMAVINASESDFNQLTTAIDKSEGSAARMSETMKNNLTGSLTEFQSAMEGLGIAVFEKISEPLQSVVKIGTSALHGLTEALKDTRIENELVVDQIKEANESLQSSIDNAGQVQVDAAAKAGQIGVLTEALTKLNGQEELDETQKRRLKQIYDELVELVPDMAGYYNEETGKIDLTTEAVKNLTKVRKDEIIERGRLAALSKIYEEMGRAQAELQKATADLSAMEKQRTMWETLRDRIGEAQSEYQNCVDYMTGTVDMSGMEGLRQELLDIAQAALNSGAITTATYNEIADLFDNDDWSEGELIAAYDKLQFRIEETDLDIKEAKKGMDDLQTSYDDAALTVQNLEEAVDSSNEKFDQEVNGLKDVSNNINDARDEHIALKKATHETAEATEEAAEATNKETKAVENNRDAHEELRNEVEARQQANRKTVQTTEEATAALEEATKAVHDNAKAEETLRNATQQARDDMSKAFEEIKKSAEDAFKVNPFDKWSQDAEKGMLAFEEAMLSQRDGLLRYKDNLTTVKNNLGEVAPEFVQYLENMGAGGAQLVAEFADAFNTGNADVVYRLMDEYKQALDIQDDVTNIIEQDKLALVLGLESLTPEAINAWEELGYAFTEGVEVVRASGEELTKTTSDSFWQAVDIAKSVGMEVPKGLADSIRNSEDPEQAIADATLAINNGLRGRGIELLAAAQELGVVVPQGVAAAIQDKNVNGEELQNAVTTLVGTIRTKAPDFEAAGTEAGEALGDATTTGISNKQTDVEQETKDMIDSAKTAGSNASPTFWAVGTSMMSALNLGMLDKKQTIVSRVESNLLQAKTNAVTTMTDIYKSLGSHLTEIISIGMAESRSSFDGAFDQLNTDAFYKMQTIKGTISTAIGEIQTAFSNAHLSLPHIQLPHIYWDWDTIYYGDGGWFQVPNNFRVNWFAKAMDDGMILNNPTIFGMMNGKLLGGGEAGSETVVGTDSLMQMIEESVGKTVNFDSVNESTNQRLDQLIGVLGQYMPQILDATQSGKVWSPSGNFMGELARATSETMGNNVRRAR